MFYTSNGWVEAEDLHAGDVIVSLGGVYGTVDSVIIENTVQTMYDLTVEEVHNFAVGDGDWVVHNCDFVCFGSEAEASQVADDNSLSFPESGIGNRQEKWIATSGSTNENATFGSPSQYTNRMEISTSGDAVGWLNRNSVEYIDYQIALEEGRSFVIRNDGVRTLIGDVLVLTKTNEPGWFGLTRNGLGLFNRNVTNVNNVTVRRR